jgi:hypothetical protein
MDWRLERVFRSSVINLRRITSLIRNIVGMIMMQSRRLTLLDFVDEPSVFYIGLTLLES